VLSTSVLAVVVLAGVLVWFFAFRAVRPNALSRADLDAGLDALVTSCSEPWARPPLTGTAKMGNAATDQLAVVASMKGELPNPQDVNAWNAALEGDAKPYASSIARFSAELDALRDRAARFTRGPTSR
jgi:hypothetical protein